MGRTLLPWSRLVEEEEEGWAKFRRALRAEDRPLLDAVFRAARLHAPSAAYIARPLPFESVVMAALVEILREARALRARIEAIERTTASPTPPA